MTDTYTEYREGRRLHPLTLLYRLATNAPAIFLSLYFAFQGRSEEWVNIGIWAFLAIFILPSVLLGYFYFTYYITHDELVIRSGVLSRKQRNIPIKRIQNISTEQNFLNRLLGLVKVNVETAGDAGSEGSLEYVSPKDAAEINRIIKLYQHEIESDKEESANETSNDDSEIADETVEEKKPEILFSMGTTDLIIYGMTRLRPVVLIFGVWAFSFGSQFVPQYTEEYLTEIIENIENFNPIEYTGIIIAALFFVLFSSWILDILLTINQYNRFTLSKEKNKLFTSYGLLSRKQSAIPLKKLQSISIKTNPIKKLLDFYSVGLHTAGLGVRTRGTESVVPLAKFRKSVEIANRAYNFEFPAEFKKVSRLTIRRAFLRYIWLLVVASAFVYFVFDILPWLLIALPLFYYAAVLRWQFRGYHFTDDAIFIKQGFWIQKTSIIPIKKIQTLHVRQSFFQRRLGLATLLVDTASSPFVDDAKIVDIDTEEAHRLMNEISQRFKEYISIG